MILDWQNLEGEELTGAWAELEKWVWWLRSTYSASREAVPDCWPAHPDLVQELTAMAVWWEEIYDPLANDVPDPNGKASPDVSEESNGRSAVAWHEALNHASQRWRTNAKCSTSECILDKHNPELVLEWRRRHARTLTKLRESSVCTSPLLGETNKLEGAAS